MGKERGYSDPMRVVEDRRLGLRGGVVVQGWRIIALRGEVKVTDFCYLSLGLA